MSEAVRDLLEKARQSIGAAELLLRDGYGGFFRQPDLLCDVLLC